MDSGDGKEKGGITAARKGEEMKSLEKATADYEKAKEKMEASKARYEADLKRFKAAEIAKTEAENLEIVRIIRAMDMSIPEGEIGVLPGHIPVTVMMAPGVTHITKADGSIRHIAIHDGFVEIQPDKISIMAEIAEWPEEVDLDRAKAALSRARERITNPGPDTDIARARRAWARAAARIELLTREW